MKRGAMSTILVVDDTPANLSLLVDYLGAQNFKVLVSRDGEEAIEQARIARPDLILLDVMMPRMDGYECCRQLKDDDALREIPVIFTEFVYAKSASGTNYQLWKRQGTAQTYTTGGNINVDTNTIKITHTATRINFYIRSATRVVTMATPLNTENQSTSVTTSKAGSVTQLSSSSVINSTAEKATRSVVDFFDITSNVNGDWNWFTNRESKIQYNGSSDGRTAFIVHLAYEIEYARRRIQFTDEVSADTLTYIDIPILVRYMIGSGNTKPYIEAGPSIVILSKAEVTSGSDKEDIKDETKGTNTSVVLGVGVSIPVGNNAVFGGARYAIGLTNISETDGVEVKINGAQVVLGFTFKLGSK